MDEGAAKLELAARQRGYRGIAACVSCDGAPIIWEFTPQLFVYDFERPERNITGPVVITGAVNGPFLTLARG